MRKRYLAEDRQDPMGLFMDPIMDFIGLMFFMVIFLLIEIDPDYRKLRMLEVDPPPISVDAPCYFAIPVQGGLGDRVFEDEEGALEKIGLKLEPDTGIIYGTPSASAFTEERKVLISVRDQSGKSVSRALRLRPAPGLYAASERDLETRLLANTNDLPVARVGRSYQGAVGAEGALGLIAWRSTGLPRELRLEGGKVVGVPRTAGEIEFEVAGAFAGPLQEIDGKPLKWTSVAHARAMKLRVLPPLALTRALPVAFAGEPFSAALFESPLRPGETLTVAGLPEGLGYTRDGLLSGTVKQAGAHTISVTVHDGEDKIAAGQTLLSVLGSARPEVRDLVLSGRVDEELAGAIAYRGLGEPVSLTGGPLPEGLVWDGVGLRGKPVRTGQAETRVTLVDARARKVTAKVSITVLPSLDPLEISAPAELSLVVGRPFSLPIRTLGGYAAAVVEPDGELPSGFAMERGLLAGRAEAPGEWRIALKASDPVSGTVVRQELVARAAWAVADPLEIATQQLPPALTGRPYQVTLAAKGAVGAVVWSVHGVLPRWLRHANGQLSGTPPEAGLSRFEIAVNDATGRKAGPRTVELVVHHVEATVPEITTAALPEARVGVPYAIDLAAQGGFGLYEWELSGRLPSSFRLEAGRLKGQARPDEVGSYPLAFNVADDLRQKAERRLVLEVRAAAASSGELAIRTRSLPPAVVGAPYDVVLASTGGAGRIAWKVEGLPAGLSQRDGQLFGTPGTSGTWAVRVTASDLAGSEVGPVVFQLRASTVAEVAISRFDTLLLSPIGSIPIVAGVSIGALTALGMIRMERRRRRRLFFDSGYD